MAASARCFTTDSTSSGSSKAVAQAVEPDSNGLPADSATGIEDHLASQRAEGMSHESLDDALDEIRANVVVTQSKRDILAASMSMICDNVQELRTHVVTANKASLASAKRVQQLSDDLGRNPAASLSGGMTAASATPVLVLGVGVLVLTWALLFYVKTGNLYVALAGLVVANLAGCATILMGRPESE